MNEEVWDTAKLRTRVFDTVMAAGTDGVTWVEVAEIVGRHHGSASGALSVLHKRGSIARLTEKRHGRRVYVHPAFIDGRATEEQGFDRTCPHCGGHL